MQKGLRNHKKETRGDAPEHGPCFACAKHSTDNPACAAAVIHPTGTTLSETEDDRPVFLSGLR
jgi:hypothetical protein